MMGEKRKLVEVPSDSHANAASGLNWSVGSHNKIVRSEFSQSWIKSCPSLFPVHCQPNKMVYCFVCGNATCEENTAVIYSRQPPNKPDSPFFPFMEYHDPAPGAEPMNNWSVLSCFVCNAFLVQQWHSFERYKTPINKRLYWLKRPSGCEIRQPVSQIELEEMLNENVRDVVGTGGGGGDQGDLSDNENENTTPASQPQRNNSTSTILPKLLKSEFESATAQTTESSTAAMEPTTTQQAAASSNEPQVATAPSSSVSSSTTTTAASVTSKLLDSNLSLPMVHCYCCGEAKQLNLEVCRIYVRPSYEQMRVGVPFYPGTLQHPMAEKAQILHNSITFVCISCLPRFPPHWHQLQKDFLKQFNHPPMLPRIPLPETVSCYLCQEMVDTKYNDHLVSLADTRFGGEKLCKYLESKPMMPLSVPLKFDFTYLCDGCMTSVKKECCDDKKSGE